MEYDKEKEKINKQKNILKKVSFIILTLEAIFFTSEEIIDLAYTTEIPSEESKSNYNKKFRYGLLRIILNLLCSILILFFMIKNYYNALLLGGMMYLVLGLIAFLYLILVSNSSASTEARPEGYYLYHIGTLMDVFYIISGVFLLSGAGCILYYVRQLYLEKKIKVELEKLMLIKQIEGKTNMGAPLTMDAEYN